MAGTNTTRMLLVTANIASCFEQPDIMLMPWINEFLKTITQLEPRFIALHCQEVGGKNYESSMQHVEHFVRALMGRGAMIPYDRIRVFLDEEYTSAEKFTALGNMYFIHEDVEDIQIWDFKENKFVECTGKREYAGNIEEVTTKEKAKFPQEFFPECKWSRKGFMRTRWCLNGTKFDMVNIHLFHDASNVIAMESYPSVYSLNRKRALEHTLDRFHNDGFEKVPFFMFGDFNFRLDTQGVVKKLTQSCSNDVGEVPDTGEKTTDFKDKDGKMVLTVSKKGFKHNDHHNIFLKDNGSWMREFDKELSSFGDRLHEYQISFPPSYPFEEGVKGEGQHYMQTRCPSWCDRIILNKAAKELVDRAKGEAKYNLIGLSTRMGDHKPVSLCVEVPMGAGTVSCCSPARPCPNFVHDPRAPCFLSAGWCLCQSYPACPRPIKTATFSSSGVQPPGSSFPNNPPSQCIPPVPTLCSVVALAGGGEENSHINGNAALCVKDEKKSGQCVCSTGASEEKISACHCSIHGNNLMQSAGVESHDLLRNLLLLNSERARILVESSFKDCGLKRVNSETFAEKYHRAKVSKEDLDMCHTRLVASRSLDTARNNQAFSTNSKLRLRATSSRLLSHHSSSTEEWFEEVLDDQEEGLVSGASQSGTANVEVKSEPYVLMSPVQVQVDVSQDDDYASFRSPSPQNIGNVSASVSFSGSNSQGGDVNSKGIKVSDTAQHSLNNLLLSDSCDHLATTNQYNMSDSSLSALCSEDCVSYSSRANRDGETVSQAPTYNIADMDLVDLVGVVKVPNKCQSDVDPLPQSSAERSPSPANCCCVLS